VTILQEDYQPFRPCVGFSRYDVDELECSKHNTYSILCNNDTEQNLLPFVLLFGRRANDTAKPVEEEKRATEEPKTHTGL
jgi:hypothetical protein